MRLPEDRAKKNINLFQALAVTISKKWKKLGPDDRKEYEIMAKKEMKEYREKLNVYQLELARKAAKAVEPDEAKEEQDSAIGQEKMKTNAKQKNNHRDMDCSNAPSLSSSSRHGNSPRLLGTDTAEHTRSTRPQERSSVSPTRIPGQASGLTSERSPEGREQEGNPLFGKKFDALLGRPLNAPQQARASTALLESRMASDASNPTFQDQQPAFVPAENKSPRNTETTKDASFSGLALNQQKTPGTSSLWVPTGGLPGTEGAMTGIGGPAIPGYVNNSSLNVVGVNAAMPGGATSLLVHNTAGLTPSLQDVLSRQPGGNFVGASLSTNPATAAFPPSDSDYLQRLAGGLQQRDPLHNSFSSNPTEATLHSLLLQRQQQQQEQQYILQQQLNSVALGQPTAASGPILSAATGQILPGHVLPQFGTDPASSVEMNMVLSNNMGGGSQRGIPASRPLPSLIGTVADGTMVTTQSPADLLYLVQQQELSAATGLDSSAGRGGTLQDQASADLLRQLQQRQPPY